MEWLNIKYVFSYVWYFATKLCGLPGMRFYIDYLGNHLWRLDLYQIKDNSVGSNKGRAFIPV